MNQPALEKISVQLTYEEILADLLYPVAEGNPASERGR